MTVGVAFVSGSFSPMTFIKMPIIPATILASFFLISDSIVPRWLANSTKLIGDMTIPLMLFTLGVCLSKLKIQRLKVPLLLRILGQGMGLGCRLALVALMQLKGPAVGGVVALQCSMPVAVFRYLFAAKFNQRPEEVAGAVISSTIIGFIVLPPLVWYVLP